MKVVWSSEASYTFEQNIIYLQTEWNESVIDSFITRTEQAIELISKNPLLFPVLNKKKAIHRCVIVKQITLYYHVADNYVLLLTFWNNYQNPKKLKNIIG